MWKMWRRIESDSKLVSKVLFVSQLPLGRCENLTAVWEAFDGLKTFKQGAKNMQEAEHEGYSVIVCDCLPWLIKDKTNCKSINLGHGISGDKTYGADEPYKPWFDPEAAAQTDYVISTSKATIPIVARQFGVSEDHVLPLGMPRTDNYFKKPIIYHKYNYLYVPTFRNIQNGDGQLANINWVKLDSLLNEHEKIIVKRHYFTKEPLLKDNLSNILEIDPSEPSEPYLRDCGVVLTDYSSIVFDGYLFNKPSVLITDDIEAYLSKRGMIYDFPDFYSSRYLTVENHEEDLVKILREAAQKGMTKVEKNCISVVADACDGHSTERICNLIKDIM